MSSSSAQQYRLLIDGRLLDGVDYIDVKNPAVGDVVSRAPLASTEQVDMAVAAAQKAFGPWAAASHATRKNALLAMADVIEKNAAELAVLITKEQGKPLKGLGSEFEVAGCVGWLRYTASLEMPVEVIEDSAAQRVEVHRRPVGVVGSITPWNWPLLIAVWHLAPALRAGCTVVMKPSEFTPLSTLRMAQLVSEVLPPGVLNIVTGGTEVGRYISRHPGIRKMIFTGSSAAGRDIMEKSAATLKRLTLELGGNDPGIVLPDADPKAIAQGLFWGAFINCGQTCAALKRLYVHETIFDETCAELLKVVNGITVGNGLEEGSMIGPIQNRRQYNKVRELVEDALAKGGQALCGGQPIEGPGHFYPLTLIVGVANGVPLVDEEQFGPVLPIIKYRDIDEAIRLANDSPVGLGASLWTSDPAAAAELASRLECGTVWFNKHGEVAPNIPFGGVKGSGFGVEFGDAGLMEYTTIQVVTMPKQ